MLTKAFRLGERNNWKAGKHHAHALLSAENRQFFYNVSLMSSQNGTVLYCKIHPNVNATNASLWVFMPVNRLLNLWWVRLRPCPQHTRYFITPRLRCNWVITDVQNLCRLQKRNSFLNTIMIATVRMKILMCVCRHSI